jgi:hypothetical protein
MKRVVVRHHSGLMQIIGLADTQPEETLIPAVLYGEQVLLNLVAAKPRFYLYTIMQSPSETMQRFHRDQQ